MPLGRNIIAGIVHDSSGNPVPMARISFTRGPVPLQDIAALTNSEGKFSLTAPVEGAYSIRSVMEGFEPAEIDVVTTAGAEARIEITLKDIKRHK